MDSITTLDALPVSTMSPDYTLPPPPRWEKIDAFTPTAVGGMTLLKEDDTLIIGGYASVEMVDREKHFIPLETLEQAFDGFMKDERYQNIMFAHGNVQVGVVLSEWESPTTGKLYKSGVDEKGLFVVAELRTDHTVAKFVSDNIKTRKLTGFSISGMGKQFSDRQGTDGVQFKQVDKLELYEITICEIPVNQGAHFNVLKSGIFLEEVVRSLDKSIPLGWQVNVVHGGVELPYQYQDPWLQASLVRKSRGRPSLYGSYDLHLTPVSKRATGLRLGDTIIALGGEIVKSGHSLGGFSLIVKTKEGSPLGSVIRRQITASLPKKWSGLVEFQMSSGDLDEDAIPLFFLSARKSEGVKYER